MKGKHRRKRRSRWLGIPLVIAMGVTTMALLEPSTAHEPSGSSLSSSEELALPQLVKRPELAQIPRERVPGVPYYTVKAGDTLSSIAEARCGNASAWSSLWLANKGSISNPGIITPGERIVISCHAGA
jgi:nucleoid-associated protein YgaU